MIKFEIKKTYSRALALTFFALTAMLAVFVVFASNNALFATPSYSASLTGNQLTQYALNFLLSQKNNFLWWLAVIVFFTLLGFLCGRFIDAKRSKYIKINGKAISNLK